MSGVQVNFLSVCQPNNCFGPYSLPFSFVAVSSLVSLLSPIYLSLSLYLESTFSIRHHEFLELWVRRFNTSALPSLCSSQCSVSAANENKPAKPNRPHRYHPSHCSYVIHTWLICWSRATLKPLLSYQNTSTSTSGSLSIVSSTCIQVLYWLTLSLLAFEFFNYINMFYSSITDFCNAQSCPSMSAGPG